MTTPPPSPHWKALHFAMDTWRGRGAELLSEGVQENGNKSIAPVVVTVLSTRLKFDSGASLCSSVKMFLQARTPRHPLRLPGRAGSVAFYTIRSTPSFPSFMGMQNAANCDFSPLFSREACRPGGPGVGRSRGVSSLRNMLPT